MGFFEWLSLKFSQQQIGPASGSTAANLAIRTSFKAAALYTAISYVSTSFAQGEIKTIEEGEEVKGRMYYLLNVQPNPNQNAFEFWTLFIERMFMNRDGALAVLLNDRFYVADSFHIDRNHLGKNKYTSIVVEGELIDLDFDSTEVVNVKVEEPRVRALVDDMLSTYEEMMAVAVTSFKNGHGSKFKLKVPPGSIAGDSDFAKKQQEITNKSVKTFMENANAVYREAQGNELEPFKIDGACDASDVAAIRKDIFNATFDAFKIPLAMVNGTITSVKDAMSQFLTFCVNPPSKAISKELTAKTVEYSDWLKESSVTVDTSRIAHISIFDIADQIGKLIGSGFPINETRTMVDLPKLDDPEADKVFVTKNYAPIEEVMRQLTNGGGGENNNGNQ